MFSGVRASSSRRLRVAEAPPEQVQVLQSAAPVEVGHTARPSAGVGRLTPNTISSNKQQALAAFLGAVAKNRSSSCTARQHHQLQQGQHAAQDAARAMTSTADCTAQLSTRPKHQTTTQMACMHNAGITLRQPTGAGSAGQGPVATDSPAACPAAVHVAVLPNEHDRAIKLGIADTTAAAGLAGPQDAAATAVPVKVPNSLSQPVLRQARKSLEELQQQLASRSSTYLYQIDNQLKTAKNSVCALSDQCCSWNGTLSHLADKVNLPGQMTRSARDAGPAINTSCIESVLLELLDICRLIWVSVCFPPSHLPILS